MIKYIHLIITIFIIAISLTELLSNINKPYDISRAEKLYIDQCSKCHRKNGTGIRRVYPPLKNADYIRNNSVEELLRGMIYGRSGRIVVNGVTYNGVMETEVDKTLSDYDIGLILTYVLWEFNDIKKIVTPEEVQSARKAGKLPVHK